MHCMTWYTSMCSIKVMGLMYTLDSMVQLVQMCYMSLVSNDFFVIGAAIIGGSLNDVHY